MRTFLFKITPWRAANVWRVIEASEESALDDLHHIIQQAFDLGYDHLYAFFLNNRAWDLEFEYGGPEVTECRHRAEETTLGSLPLRRNKRFLYLFDFGDELRHEVKVVGESVVEAGVRYPRVVEAHGEAPPQYPMLDEAPDAEGDGEDEDVDVDVNEVEEDVEDVRCDATHLDDTREQMKVTDESAEAEHLSAEESPAQDALVSAVKQYVMAYKERGLCEEEALDEQGDVQVSTRDRDQLTQEYDLALTLLEGSRSDLNKIRRAIEDDEDLWGVTFWDWLIDLSMALSTAGLHDQALRLADKINTVWHAEAMVCELPLLLARAGEAEAARQQVEANLAEYTDDPWMLLNAGSAFQELGDVQQAESCYREALTWVGGATRVRKKIVTSLVDLLEAEGRTEEVQTLKESEAAREREMQQNRMRKLGLIGPPPARRDAPKIGRNAPCPCGSGKKYKKCCGGV